MKNPLMDEELDFGDTLAITRAWIADREALLEECARLQHQRDKARRWAILWKYAAHIKRHHYIRTSEYLEKERDDHKVTRDYFRDFVPKPRYPR